MNKLLIKPFEVSWPAHRKRLLALIGGSVLFSALSGCSALPNSYEIRLAEHLTESGAKLYGAYWCPYSAAQKNAFASAMNLVPYVECDAEGYSAQPEDCQAAGIEVYPTWVIGGDRYSGVQTLGKLARLSGFEQPAVKDEEPSTPGGYSVPR